MDETPQLSKGLADEVFCMLGERQVINIAALIDAINTHGIGSTFKQVEISKLLSDCIFSDQINEETIQSMAPTRRDEPVVIAQFNQKLFIIDGNHRLHRRIIDNFDHCDVICIDESMLEIFFTTF